MQWRAIEKTKKLVIVGDGPFAELAHQHFTHDSPYTVSGFAVEGQFQRKKELFGLPVVPLEQVTKYFPADTHETYVAIAYNQLNRLRTRLMQQMENYGYTLASYISQHAFIWPNAVIGKHNFVFEFCVVQPFAILGDNNILWSSTHIGHHSQVGDNVFLARAIISGFCKIGSHCFVGANATVSDNITIGDDCFINMVAAVTKNLEPNKMYCGQPARAYRDNAREFFRIAETAMP